MKSRNMSNRNNPSAFQILEFDTIVERVAEQAVSPLGRERIEGLLFHQDPDVLKRELDRVAEMRDLLRFDDPLPFHAFPDLRPYLQRADVMGAFLQPKELLEIERFLAMARQVKAYFEERREKCTLLQERARGMQALKPLEQEISKAIDPSGEVLGSSPSIFPETLSAYRETPSLALLAGQGAGGEGSSDRRLLRQPPSSAAALPWFGLSCVQRNATQFLGLMPGC